MTLLPSTLAPFLHFAAIQRLEGYDRILFQWSWVGWAVATLMVLLASWKLVVISIQWWHKPRSNPLRLLNQLAHAHRLSRVEKALLNEITSSHPSGAQAAILFIDPSAWSWKQIQDPKTLESAKKLYAKIFGFPPDEMLS